MQYNFKSFNAIAAEKVYNFINIRIETNCSVFQNVLYCKPPNALLPMSWSFKIWTKVDGQRAFVSLNFASLHYLSKRPKS